MTRDTGSRGNEGARKQWVGKEKGWGSLVAVGFLAPLLATGTPAGAASCAGTKVAIDVGHTLAQPGATSARGGTEFAFNQALAAAVADALRRSGVATVVIGADGGKKALAARTAEAKAAGATLFLSLHHDTVQERYLEAWVVDGRPQRYSDRFHGYSLFVSGLNARVRESALFAMALGAELDAAGFVPTAFHAEPIPGEGKTLLDPAIGLYRYDNLVVLRTAEMPAVLLEAGVIVNRAEEAQAKDAAVMASIAKAIAFAVTRACKE